MKKIIVTLLIALSTALYAQRDEGIIINAENFEVKGNHPMDARVLIPTLADTSYIDWHYPGMKVWVESIDSTYCWNEGLWFNYEQFVAPGGIQNLTWDSTHRIMNILNGVGDTITGFAYSDHTHTENEISDLGHNADSLKGSPVDTSGLADGMVWVYRTASAKWVLEAKPAAGSTPAWADITGSIRNADSIWFYVADSALWWNDTNIIATQSWVLGQDYGGNWGSITGTLSSQTDLWAYLNDSLIYWRDSIETMASKWWVQNNYSSPNLTWVDAEDSLKIVGGSNVKITGFSPTGHSHVSYLEIDDLDPYRLESDTATLSNRGGTFTGNDADSLVGDANNIAEIDLILNGNITLTDTLKLTGLNSGSVADSVLVLDPLTGQVKYVDGDLLGSGLEITDNQFTIGTGTGVEGSGTGLTWNAETEIFNIGRAVATSAPSIRGAYDLAVTAANTMRISGTNMLQIDAPGDFEIDLAGTEENGQVLTWRNGSTVYETPAGVAITDNRIVIGTGGGVEASGLSVTASGGVDYLTSGQDFTITTNDDLKLEGKTIATLTGTTAYVKGANLYIYPNATGLGYSTGDVLTWQADGTVDFQLPTLASLSQITNRKHAGLASLDWIEAAHTGTANTIPFFAADGDADYTANFQYDAGSLISPQLRLTGSSANEIAGGFNMANGADISGNIHISIDSLTAQHLIRTDTIIFETVPPYIGRMYTDENDSLWFKNSEGELFNLLRGGTGGGGSMVYPGAGIAVSTGSAWGTSITDNSANWNTAYGWGDHSTVGYLTSADIPDVNVGVDKVAVGDGTGIIGPDYLEYDESGDVSMLTIGTDFFEDFTEKPAYLQLRARSFNVPENGVDTAVIEAWGGALQLKGTIPGGFKGSKLYTTFDTVRFYNVHQLNVTGGSGSTVYFQTQNVNQDVIFDRSRAYMNIWQFEDESDTIMFFEGGHIYMPRVQDSSAGKAAYQIYVNEDGRLLIGDTVVGSGGGGSMVYPGAGIAVSTGSAWGTSITDNSANWNTAYGWGDHSGQNYATTTGDTYTGAHDFGGATSIEIINGANPTTDAAGEIAIDSDDAFLEFYDGTASRVLPALQSRTFVIATPDDMQAESDDVVLFHVIADAYPHGITIKDIALSGSASFSDTHVIEEWDDRAGTTQSTIESITVAAAQYQEDDGTLSDASIAADAFIVINLDDATDDISLLEITITFYVNEGN